MRTLSPDDISIAIEERSKEDLLKVELAAAIARAEKAEAACAEMRNALGMSGPWPVIEVLHILANWCDHLGQEHDCDCNGYEVRIEAIKSARLIVLALQSALGILEQTGGTAV